MIAAQFALSLNYRAELVEGEDNIDIWHRKFRVIPLAQQGSGAVSYTFDDEGSVTSTAPEDFGLFDEPDKSRICSIVSCSCQFAISSGLDLCRHRINRAMALQDLVPEGELYYMVGTEVATKWCVLTPEDEAEATRALRLMPRPSAAETQRPAAVQDSSRDRYLLLLEEMKRVADIASKSSFATQLVQRKMGDIHASLMQGEAHGAIEEEDHEGVDDDDKEELNYSIDWRSLMDVIRGEYTVDDAVDEDYVQNVELWISHIAYKWNGAGRKGWHVAAVSGVTPDDNDEQYSRTTWGDLEINAEIYSFSDKTTSRVALQLENLATNVQENHPKHSWVCLEGTPLGEDVAAAAAQGAVRPPHREKKKGPHAGKRLAPVGGPTSRRQRQR